MTKASTHILIVDDDDTSCRVFAAMLNHVGYATKCVSNGEECITIMQQTHFDLLLLDWVMPVMAGEEAVALIRKGAAGEQHINIPIIAVTADLVGVARERCLAAGATVYMTKPLDLYDMVETIQSLLA